MQELSLPLNQISPVKKTSSQSQKGMPASEQDSVAPKAFAEMFKQQVKQQQATPAPNLQAQKPVATQPRQNMANAKQAEQAVANKQTATAKGNQASTTPANTAKSADARKDAANEQSETDKTVNENQGLQEAIMLQLGLQTPVLGTTSQIASAEKLATSTNSADHSAEALAVTTDADASVSVLDPNLKPVPDAATSLAKQSKDTPVVPDRADNAQAAFGLNTAQQAVALTDANSKEVLADKLLKLQANADMAAPTIAARPELNTLTNTAASQGAQTVASTYQVTAAFGKADWNQAIHQRVVYMLGAGEQTATLTLNPPNLGPLQVVIKVDNDHVDTTFISNNADVRQALQDGLGMLKDKLNDSGMQMGNTNVSSQEQSQRDFQQMADQRAQQQAKQGETANADDDTVVSAPVIKVVSNGLVDTFV